MAKLRRKRSKGRNFLLLIIIGVVLFLIVKELPGQQKRDRVKYATDIQELHPVVAKKKDELIRAVAKKGITIVITDAFRSAEHQDKLYSKGRKSEGQIVTNAKGGESYHNYGLAIDFAIKTKSGDIIWDMKYDGNGNGKADWLEVVEAAKKLGFEWGGDWPDFPDYPHLQIPFDLSIKDLKKGKRPEGDVKFAVE